jgi:serine/threonine-protein kinase RsbW
MLEPAAREAVVLLLHICIRRFPGGAEQASAARRFVAAALGDDSLTDDAVLCVSELAANAILHSSSGQPGGWFEVQVSRYPGGRIHVAVTDQGGPWAPDPASRTHHGRGLLAVSCIAAQWGITGNAQGRTAWFELGIIAPVSRVPPLRAS